MTKVEGQCNEKCPTEDSYRLLIEREWADVHHSRIQEWSALGVITGAHIGLIQLLKITKEEPTFSLPIAALIGCILGFLFVCIGILITCRHRYLMWVKLSWIYDAEDKLCLIKKDPSNLAGIIPEVAKIKRTRGCRKLMLPPLLSTSGLIFLFHALFGLSDIVAIVFALRAL